MTLQLEPDTETRPCPTFPIPRKHQTWPGRPWYERLHEHNTASSARRSIQCRTDEEKDELDFVMESAYCPQVEIFSEKGDPYLHVETVYGDSQALFMRAMEPGFLPHSNDLVRAVSKNIGKGRHATEWKFLKSKLFVRPDVIIPRDTYLIYSNGGVERKGNIYNVKLGIAAPHTPQTNPGYSRTPSGAFYSI